MYLALLGLCFGHGNQNINACLLFIRQAARVRAQIKQVHQLFSWTQRAQGHQLQ